MNATPIPSWWAVGVSVLLVVVAVAIAAWQRLGISREIVVAAARAFVQLVAVGAVLAWLFANAGVAGALLWIAGMTVVAANESRLRGRGLPPPSRRAAGHRSRARPRPWACWSSAASSTPNPRCSSRSAAWSSAAPCRRLADADLAASHRRRAAARGRGRPRPRAVRAGAFAAHRAPPSAPRWCPRSTRPRWSASSGCRAR